MTVGSRGLNSRTAQSILRWTREREPEMLALLERLVRINSYTANKAGTDAVGAVLREAMTGLGFGVQVVPQADAGDHLIARCPGARRLAPGQRQVLFCGHMDTVFPPDSGFDAFVNQGDRVTGPGVIDMKGGLVAGIYALAALAAHGQLEGMPVAFVFNSDEETGSYRSRELIMAEAARSAFAFVFECSGPGGETTTGRKGKTTLRVRATGRAGHAGNLGHAKPSAVLELAHKTIALEALNDAARGVSVNVGLVSGGVGPNTVAPRAEATVECRYRTAADGEALVAAAVALAGRPEVPGTAVEVEVVPGRPPMEPGPANRRLLEHVVAAGRELDVPVAEDYRGGVSDANYIAQVGTPVLDGLGPGGERDHSPEEYMITSTLAARAALAAVSARRIWDAMTREGRISGGGAA
ncbi:M20 family metallopeptidase [Desulfocurvus sp.]|uniref:M20 family metallopeptidase n=1 Tax=Desulfocurvus sp. TaxID=2871698 RepID=UPI0025C042E9|nr:M20 family metallopeptidase [Desulfocurvus sp.]MCK9239540.1 M20 family metallopeptidase [Desulfocurvus sp.]